MKRAGYFVLLLKGSIDEDDSDNDNAYKETLLPAQSVRVPVLEFESIREGARAVLARPYDAVIVTSARALWSLQQHLNETELHSLRQAT